MIYALLLQNFVVKIYALFPQNILYLGAHSANFFAFWMYDSNIIWEIGHLLNGDILEKGNLQVGIFD